jgi:hypothetical protein
LTIAFQIGLTYWFYLYIVWFFPFVLVVLFCQLPTRTVAPPLGGALALSPSAEQAVARA